MRAFTLWIKILLFNHKTFTIQEFLDICKRVRTTFRNPCLDTVAPVKRIEKIEKCLKGMLTM